MSPGFFWLMLKKKIQRKLLDPIQRKKDLAGPKTTPHPAKINQTFIDIQKLDISKLDRTIAEYHIEMFLAHRFDLLGSGWVRNAYQINPLGVEGHLLDNRLQIEDYSADGAWLEKVLLPQYADKAKIFWQQIIQINPDYQPIDWQLDFKSGFRFSAIHWYKDQVGLSAGKKGVDIKVPWELSRLQHLVQLAVFALAIPEKKETVIKEIRCQILDFIMANPVRMGVNWTVTMDVGIRAANMLIAYDLLKQQENLADPQFDQEFAEYMYAHGTHIMQNFEYYGRWSSNHYMGNIAGLLFLGAYFDHKEWTTYSKRELKQAMEWQYFDDGVNFEGSVSYHRLSTEMMLYCTALMQQLGEEIPEWYWKKLGNALVYTHSMIKPTNEITQFGDNDSGRFIRLTPTGEMFTAQEAENKYANLKGYASLFNDKYWDENGLNHSTLLSAGTGIFKEAEVQQDPFCLERSMIRTLSSEKGSPVEFEHPKAITKKLKPAPTELEHTQTKTIDAPKGTIVPLTANMKRADFMDAQVVVFRSDRVYLAINAFYNEWQQRSWGHTHNDHLSIELQIDEQDIFRDPGTYLYTPIPKKRNDFRSTQMHHTAYVNSKEQNSWGSTRMDLFKLSQDTKSEILELSENYASLMVRYKDVIHHRTIEIKDFQIIIQDHCNHPFTVNWQEADEQQFSNGYGKLLTLSS